jgi:hypothetical protein
VDEIQKSRPDPTDFIFLGLRTVFYSAEDGGDCVREGKFEAVDNFLFYSIIKAIIKM